MSGEVDTQPIEKRVLINQWEQTLQERQREEAEASRRIQPTRKYEPPTQVSYDDQVSSVRSRFDDLSTQPQNKVRHWEVKAPSRVVLGGPGQIRTDNRKEDYPAPTQPQYESSSSESEGPEGESIVEREIRLTLKREASLRRRQRKAGGTSTSSAPPREAPVERTPSISQSESESEEEPQTHGQEVIKSEPSDRTYTSPEFSKTKSNRSNGYEDDRSYRANSKPSRREPARNEKPAEPAQFYREMTEADRGAEMKQRESIIEREIREQQEREAVLRLQRGLPPPSPPSPPAHRPSVHSESEGSYYSDSVSSRSPSPEPRDSPPPSARYERKPARYADDQGPAPSSLIEQEILENQRREEELRAARLSATNNGNGSSRSPTAAFSPSAAYSPGPSTGSSDTQRRDSRDSLESYGASSRDSRDQLDGATRQSMVSPFDESVGYRDKPETPIEREIRIAREREAEMRQERGLPSPQPSSEVMVEVHEYSGRSRMDPDLQEEHERRLASMRLQKEMEKERRREEELQSQGAIKGTSHQYTDNPAPLPGSSSSSSRRKSGRPYKNKTPEANNNPAPVQSSAPGRGSRSSGFDSSSVRGDQAGRIPSKIQRELDEDRKREEEFRLARTSVSGGAAQTSQHF